MPRRKSTTRKTLGTDAKGRYFRNLGYLRSASGKYSQKKFYLGYDEDEAKIAVARLESLWRHVEVLHQAAQKVKLTPARMDYPPLDYDDIQASDPTRAIWTSLSLLIAESIRQGEHVALIPFEQAISLSGADANLAASKNGGVVPMTHSKVGLEGVLQPMQQIGENNLFASPVYTPEKVDGVTEIAMWLDKVRQWFPVIHIEVDAPELSQAIDDSLSSQGEWLLSEGRRLAAEPLTNHKLHLAIETYKASLIKDRVDLEGETTEWAKAKGRQIQFVADHCVNLDLAQLGVPSINSILQVLAKRPITKKGKHCSVRHAQNCMKEFKKFLEWLDKCDSYNWIWPQKFEWKSPKVVRSLAAEADSKTNPVIHRKKITFNVPELTTIYQYAEPIQRLYILLGLNCGFGNAELTSLKTDEIFLFQVHPNEDIFEFGSDASQSWIARARTKTSVLGTWCLWPETVEAIRWWQNERDRIETMYIKSEKDKFPFDVVSKNYFLITQNAKPVSEKGRRTGRIPNSWNSLIKRIRESKPEFKKLSFGKIRKSGATIMRKLGNAELASIHLTHGTPYGDDDDLEAYAERPYGQLFEALGRMHDHLSPLWKAVPKPFDHARRLGGKPK